MERVKGSRQGNPPDDYQKKRILSLWSSALTAVDIGKQLKLDPKVVRLFLREHFGLSVLPRIR